MTSVVSMGHCTVDILGVVEKYPVQIDRKEELLAFTIQGGGPAATAAVALCKLGLSAKFVGKLGDDIFGKTARSFMEAEGVDCTSLLEVSGVISPMSFIAVDQGTGKRNIFWTKGNVPPLGVEEIDFDLLYGASVLLVDGHSPEAQLEVCLEARKRGIDVVLDAGSDRPGMQDLVKVSTTVIASERFGAEIAGAVDKALQAIIELGPNTAIITLGEDGAVGRHGERTEIVAPFVVDVVDTTGAGDVYHGAYIYAMLRDWSLRQRMEFAGCTAALSCKDLGGRRGLPSLKEVEDSLAGLW